MRGVLLLSVVALAATPAMAQQVACQRVGGFVQCNNGYQERNYGPYVYGQQQVQQYQQPSYQNFQQFNPGRCMQNQYQPGCR